MTARPWLRTGDGVSVAVRLTPKGGRDAIDGIETLSDGRAVLNVRVRAALPQPCVRRWWPTTLCAG